MAGANDRTYELWENAPAPNRGGDFDQVVARGYPFDADWERWSYPIGNGYIGANVFGRTDTERIQVTDKTFHISGLYGRDHGGLTNFLELYLDFDHADVSDYRRALNLNDAIAEVSYKHSGTRFDREYFVSYPDKVVVIRLAADKPGALSFRVRPEVPYVNAQQPQDARTAKVVVDGSLITLSGRQAYFPINYEAQVKVLHEGGRLTNGENSIQVHDADRVVLLVATGTNFRQGPHIFLNPREEKLDPDLLPHEQVATTIRQAVDKGYEALRENHLADYRNLFGRVRVNLNAEPTDLPTSALLDAYKQGDRATWLEELLFQYGRYLLIASSRETSLPANLQGTWSQYEMSPWTGGYWHNINVQMNYWGAFNANLAETFEAYIDYFNAYLPQARIYARDLVRQRDPELVTEEGDHGWVLGTGASTYNIMPPGGHSGPGTGGFTAKLLVDYYSFTKDREFLEEVAYPALLSLSRLYSSILVPHGDLLLVEPSASPEQHITLSQYERGVPGEMHGNGYYVTAGTTFDQGFVWKTFNDTLMLARLLGKEDPFLQTIAEQKKRLDPILIGSSGQIKEYREEDAYSEIGDPHHRHISHLCPVFPGTLVNAYTPEWRAAASRTLDLRGDGLTTGWGMAHRMNVRARLQEAEQAHYWLQQMLRHRTMENLWTTHPPFQIDGNFGVMAGVAEMLLQSHTDWIEPLPALPEAWAPSGMFEGLVARGNFVVDASWQDGRANRFVVTARHGGECRMRYPGIEHAQVRDAKGNAVTVQKMDGGIRFNTTKGKRYTIELDHQALAKPPVAWASHP